jgi:hypothetical protein
LFHPGVELEFSRMIHYLVKLINHLSPISWLAPQLYSVCNWLSYNFTYSFILGSCSLIFTQHDLSTSIYNHIMHFVLLCGNDTEYIDMNIKVPPCFHFQLQSGPLTLSRHSSYGLLCEVNKCRNMSENIKQVHKLSTCIMKIIQSY